MSSILESRSVIVTHRIDRQVDEMVPLVYSIRFIGVIVINIVVLRFSGLHKERPMNLDPGGLLARPIVGRVAG